MILWHDIENALRSPQKVKAGEAIAVWIGAYPLEPGQFVTVYIQTIFI
ncbi:MAG: hypothetical protein KGJ59_02375 [Bacteroidota bacterium]|nr:hypothetical protein [Bacteroidota bacterium]